MIKVRLEGLPEEVDRLIEKLDKTVNILNQSGHYPNRGPSKYVRVYLDVEDDKNVTRDV